MNLIGQSFKILEPCFMNQWALIETAARVSHLSEKKEYVDFEFLKRLIRNGHMSPFEFGSMTVKFITNRAVANEFVRHRHCSFMQESTRYSKFDELNIIEPKEITGAWKETMQKIEDEYQYLLKIRIHQDIARGILPLDLATTLVVKTNIREWLHIFNIRMFNEHAHYQFRELLTPLYDKLLKEDRWFWEEAQNTKLPEIQTHGKNSPIINGNNNQVSYQ